jgi:hypothetical protein
VAGEQLTLFAESSRVIVSSTGAGNSEKRTTIASLSMDTTLATDQLPRRDSHHRARKQDNHSTGVSPRKAHTHVRSQCGKG